ncbi:glycosyltransferase [Enterococcus crotali]|uniref:glycosyltransferase n=1 Tax=Enterococcus crotali TaxID=1453587 RepID=UPI0004718422|nr:nucleotide disphospho-sugar-binding domain-containing protein [Enterococcus crotali]
MKTLLFAPETFNLAETTRMIEVAKACQSQATCIFMGYSRKFASFIEKEGFEFNYLTPHLTEIDIQNIMKFDQMRTVKIPFTYDMLKQRIENELQLIEKLAPDGIIIGSTISLLISARVKKIPLIYVKPYAYSRAHIEGPLFMEESNPYVKKLVKFLLLNLKWLPKDIKKLIKEFGVKNQFECTIDAMAADLNCITTPERLTKNPVLPKDSAYVGPIFANLNEEIPQALQHLLETSTKPLIYCSMGSSANRQLIFDLLQNFDGLAVDVITPMKSYLTEEQIKQLPKNIYLFDWLPATEVQNKVTACVLHGGEGTIQTACLAGKPFIGIGLQKEQEYNINCCVKYGTAIQIKKNKLKNRLLFRIKLQELLEESTYEQQAKKLQQELQPIEGSLLAAKELMHFIDDFSKKRSKETRK